MTSTATATVNPVSTCFPPQVSSDFVDTLRRGGVYGPSLMWSSTWEDPEAGCLDSISSWRTTHTAWTTQSALSVESPLATRGLLHSAASVRNRSGRQDDRSQQSWFLPLDRVAKKAFDHLGRKLGPNRASVEQYSHITMPIESSAPHDDDLLVLPCQNNDGGRQDDLIHLVTATRGFVYVTSEELDHEDLSLQALDEEYRQAGRRRYRRIWLVYSKIRREVVGAAIAYRGPLELDFSGLTNRCDIVTHPLLSEQATASVARLLIASTASVYDDFHAETIPVITDERTGALLASYAGQRTRDVGLAIILDSAYEDWYDHLERLNERVARTRKKRGHGDSPNVHRQADAQHAGLVTAAA